MTDERQDAPKPSLEHVDLAWQPEPLQEDWPDGLDTEFIMWRMEQAFVDQAKDGAGGLLLDVACGHARHCEELRSYGWRFIGIEPSPEMVRRARHGNPGEPPPIDPPEMMFGIGETLPFKDGTFDRVLCMSSLDHFANPDLGIREMARILKPGGHLVIGLVNYAGLGCNGSRLLYRIGRRIGTIPEGKRMFWDDPTEGEHTFEGRTRTLRKWAEGVLVLEKEYGVSLMWAVPGWKHVFKIFPGNWRPMRFGRGSILRTADFLGRTFPMASDFVVTTWRKPV
jgi:SAM-dependent methyltransferase